MNINQSSWIRIFLSALLFSILVFTLKIISPLNPEWVYILLNFIIVIAINRPDSLKESIVFGILIGILSGVIISILYLGPYVFATLFFTAISIIGALLSYLIFEKIIK